MAMGADFHQSSMPLSHCSLLGHNTMMLAFDWDELRSMVLELFTGHIDVFRLRLVY